MNKQNHVVLLVLLTTLFTGVREGVYAQQESQYSQYTYNTMRINPAYAGARGRLSVLGVYCNQWQGMKGAPETINFSVSSPLGEIGQMGGGIEFTNDRIGASQQNTIAGNFSYILPFENVYVSFGIKAGATSLTIDERKLNIYDEQNLSIDMSSRFMPTFGVGTYIYGQSWYVGLSTPNFLETKQFDDYNVSKATERVHLYLIGGYVFELNNYFDLKPAVLVKATQGSPIALDVSTSVIYNRQFAFGVGYRTDAAVNAMLGFQINDNFMVGYTYDYTTSELTRYNNGSHEIFLRFELAPRSSWENARVTPIF